MAKNPANVYLPSSQVWAGRGGGGGGGGGGKGGGSHCRYTVEVC